MKKQPILLGTSPDLAQAKILIEKYFYNTQIEILEDGSIKRVSDGKILENFQVRKKAGRYRFEAKE